MKQKEIIQLLNFRIIEVKLLPNVNSSLDEMDITNFTQEKTYKIFGAIYIRFSDGSGFACWLVQDDRGVVSPKVMDKFIVTRTE